MILDVCTAAHSDAGSLILKPRIAVRVDRPFVGVCHSCGGTDGRNLVPSANSLLTCEASAITPCDLRFALPATASGPTEKGIAGREVLSFLPALF